MSADAISIFHSALAQEFRGGPQNHGELERYAKGCRGPMCTFAKSQAKLTKKLVTKKPVTDKPASINTVVLGAIGKIEDRTGFGATISLVHRSLYRRGYSREQVEHAIEALLAEGLILMIPSTLGYVGRPTVRYELV